MVNIIFDIKTDALSNGKVKFQFSLIIFSTYPHPLPHPRGPIDTKSFSTRETMGKFVLVKFESNRSNRF
jgi:hypothetical protein